MASDLPPHVWLGEDGILRIDYGFRPRIDLAAMQSAHAQHMAIGVYPVPILILGQGVMAGTREAEAYGSSDEISTVTSALAMVVTNPVGRVAVKLYLRYSRPPYPCQAFDSEASALHWLSSYVPQQDQALRAAGGLAKQQGR